MSKRILIVEDEQSTIAVAKRMLESVGYKISTALNGKEALEIVSNDMVDLIITDVIMPVMDGVDLYKELKKTPDKASIPIIIMTDSEVYKKSFMTLGVEGFLPKPIEAHKMLEEVERVFNKIYDKDEDKKVLIVGVDQVVVKDMAEILKRNDYVVSVASNGMNLITKALMFIPRVVLIDVMQQDVPARELIKALRCFISLRNMHILVYTHFTPEQLGDVDTVEQLRETKDMCLEAGATKYIGRFTSTTFMQILNEFKSVP